MITSKYILFDHLSRKPVSFRHVRICVNVVRPKVHVRVENPIANPVQLYEEAEVYASCAIQFEGTVHINYVKIECSWYKKLRTEKCKLHSDSLN